MATTSLFVEILIVGLEALVWIGLLAGTIWDLGACIKILKGWGDYSALITTLLLALAYVLGILIDRAADSFYKIFGYKPDNPPASVGKMRMRIMNSSEGIARFLDYQRSRLRIARATVFNVLVTILVGSYWMFRCYLTPESSNNALGGILMIGVGIIVLVLTVMATRRIEEAHIKRLTDAYEIVTEKKEGQ
jgi:hypothetical protein